MNPIAALQITSSGPSGVSLNLPDASRELDSIRELLDALPLQALILTHSGRVVFTNGASDRLLASGRGIDIRAGQLWLRATDRVLDLPYLRSQPMRSAFRRSRASLQAALSVRLPLAAGGSLFVEAHQLPGVQSARVNQDSLFVLFLSDPAKPQKLSCMALRDVLGLTSAESRVTAHLFEGRKLSEVAIALNVSPNTAKKHLMGIFRKCHVQSQAELMKLLALGPFLAVS